MPQRLAHSAHFASSPARGPCHTAVVPRVLVLVLVLALAFCLGPAPRADANDRFWSGIAPSFNHAQSTSAGGGSDEGYARVRRSARVPTPRLSAHRQGEHRAEHRLSERRGLLQHAQAPRVVAYADGGGREYDPASRAWFDGDGDCWRGAEPFTLQHGTWYYAGRPWQPVDGLWQTDATPAPARVDCRRIAKFRAKLSPAPEQQATRSGPGDGGLDHPLDERRSALPLPAHAPAEGASRSLGLGSAHCAAAAAGLAAASCNR